MNHENYEFIAYKFICNCSLLFDIIYLYFEVVRLAYAWSYVRGNTSYDGNGTGNVNTLYDRNGCLVMCHVLHTVLWCVTYCTLSRDVSCTARCLVMCHVLHAVSWFVTYFVPFAVRGLPSVTVLVSSTWNRWPVDPQHTPAVFRYPCVPWELISGIHAGRGETRPVDWLGNSSTWPCPCEMVSPSWVWYLCRSTCHR